VITPNGITTVWILSPKNRNVLQRFSKGFNQVLGRFQADHNHIATPVWDNYFIVEALYRKKRKVHVSWLIWHNPKYPPKISKYPPSADAKIRCPITLRSMQGFHPSIARLTALDLGYKTCLGQSRNSKRNTRYVPWKNCKNPPKCKNLTWCRTLNFEGGRAYYTWKCFPRLALSKSAKTVRKFASWFWGQHLCFFSTWQKWKKCQSVEVYMIDILLSLVYIDDE
jgi:hypothetical protein